MYGSLNILKSLTLALLILAGVCSSSYAKYLTKDTRIGALETTGTSG